MMKAIDLMPAVLPNETEALPEVAPSTGEPRSAHPYVVIVYNDEVHSFPEVIIQLQKATGCTLEKGEALAFEIHTRSRAIVFSGSYLECDYVADVLLEIRLQVEIDHA